MFVKYLTRLALCAGALNYTSATYAEETNPQVEEDPVVFGHVTLVSRPDPLVKVEGPSLEETLQHLARITVGQYSASGYNANMKLELDGCWLSFKEDQVCEGQQFSNASHSFDLSAAEVSMNVIGSYNNGSPILVRPDRQMYFYNRTSYGSCNWKNGKFKKFNEPRSLKEPRIFRINSYSHIKDHRADYAREVQSSLVHLARMCGASEEKLLFE